MSANITEKQHYISQAEQRLNALNPDASQENQRIYAFTLKNRENHTYLINKESGVKISNNMFFHDLFTYEQIDKKLRSNFENLFQRYESSLCNQSQLLLKKLKNKDFNVANELFYILVSKFMNFLRNPFSMQKAINTFGDVLKYYPTDPLTAKEYKKIRIGKIPNKDYLLSHLKVKEELYRNWLATIFMLLTDLEKSGETFLEKIVRNFLTDKAHNTFFAIHWFDKHCCIMSDRGFCTPSNEKMNLAFRFNLTSNAIIDFCNIDIASFAAKLNFHKVKIKNLLAIEQKQKKRWNVSISENDLKMLAAFNQLMAYQCHSQIYCAKKECYGLNIERCC